MGTIKLSSTMILSVFTPTSDVWKVMFDPLSCQPLVLAHLENYCSLLGMTWYTSLPFKFLFSCQVWESFHIFIVYDFFFLFWIAYVYNLPTFLLACETISFKSIYSDISSLTQILQIFSSHLLLSLNFMKLLITYSFFFKFWCQINKSIPLHYLCIV